MKPAAGQLRTRLLAAVSELPADTPILLSGGIDSATVLAASLELGRLPVCYTFHLEGSPSQDARVAASMTETTGAELRTVVIPRDLDGLLADVRFLIRSGVKPQKTFVQCAHPFHYLARQISADGYSLVSHGMAAGDLFPTSRKAMVIYSRGGQEAFDDYRRQQFDLYENARPMGISDLAVEHAAGLHGVRLADPYRHPEVVAYALGLRFDTIHRPRQKQVLVDAFPEFWARGAWYRKNSSLQVNSGIREWHDVLLTTDANRHGHKAIVGLYNSIAREAS